MIFKLKPSDRELLDFTEISPIYADGKEVKEMWWEGNDLCMIFKNNEERKYTNAFVSHHDMGPISSHSNIKVIETIEYEFASNK